MVSYRYSFSALSRPEPESVWDNGIIYTVWHKHVTQALINGTEFRIVSLLLTEVGYLAMYNIVCMNSNLFHIQCVYTAVTCIVCSNMATLQA